MKVWTVIKREYSERVRSRWFVAATVFGPVVMGAVLFLPSYLTGREHPSADVARIRILDATGTNLGRDVSLQLNGGLFGDTSHTQVVSLDPSQLPTAEQAAAREVRAKHLKGYLVLGRGVLSGADARYVGINATGIADMRDLEDVVGREVLATQLQLAGLPPDRAERFKRTRFNLRAERITQTGRGGSGRLSIFFAIIVATLLYMTILMYGQAVLRGVVEEKQSHVAEVVISSVRPVTLLAGKVIGVGGVGLTQMAIWGITSTAMIRYRAPLLERLGFTAEPFQLPPITPGAMFLLFAFFILGYILYSGLFATVGAMVSTDQEAQQAQVPIVLLLVLSLMFLEPVLNAPDSGIAIALGVLPVSSPIMMPLRMSATDVPPLQVALSLIALASGCVFAVYLASRVYRMGLLLYGKRVTVRELSRWLRESR